MSASNFQPRLSGRFRVVAGVILALSIIGLAPSGAAGQVSVPVGSGFQYPIGIAVDEAGNVFVADSVNNAVKEVPAGGGATITFGYGLQGANDVAIDRQGNLFIADTGHSAVREVLAAGGYVTVKLLSTAFSAPSGIAVDDKDNIFVTDTYRRQILELSASDNYSTVQVLVDRI
jgi:large repetitive protein